MVNHDLINQTIQWYDNNALEYSKKINNKLNHDLDAFATSLPLGSKILDVGCAAGRDSKLLEARGFAVTGIDLSTNLLSIAKKQCPSGIFVKANVLDLLFAENTFDAVWCAAVLHHLEHKIDVEKALLEAKRVMKSGAKAYFSLQYRSGCSSGILVDEHSSEGRFFQLLPLEELALVVEAAGFRILEKKTSPSLRENIEWNVLLVEK